MNLSFSRSSTADDVVADLDLTGQVMLVTGANSGIGFETARALASKGARVHVGARSEEKAEAACEEIRAAHPKVDVKPFVCDLGSLEQIRAACDTFEEPSLNVLVCNAGLYGGPYRETHDGFERTVGVCHIGHFALFEGLKNKLLAGKPARVVVVSSGNHNALRHLDFQTLPLDASNFSELTAYNQAKLCNVLFANELDRRYREAGIRANSLHPGNLISTNIDRSSIMAKVVMLFAKPFSKSLNQGAATTVMCAARPELADVGGTYFDNCQERTPSALALDEEVAAKLWDISLEWIQTGR